MKPLYIFFMLILMAGTAQAAIEVSDNITFQIDGHSYTPEAFNASTITLTASQFCIDEVCLPTAIAVICSPVITSIISLFSLFIVLILLLALTKMLYEPTNIVSSLIYFTIAFVIGMSMAYPIIDQVVSSLC